MNLTCSCCGRGCLGAQWHNRDKGYGLCSMCINFVYEGYKKSHGEDAEEEMRITYGSQGKHYFKKPDIGDLWE